MESKMRDEQSATYTCDLSVHRGFSFVLFCYFCVSTLEKTDIIKE